MNLSESKWWKLVKSVTPYLVIIAIAFSMSWTARCIALNVGDFTAIQYSSISAGLHSLMEDGVSDWVSGFWAGGIPKVHPYTMNLYSPVFRGVLRLFYDEGTGALDISFYALYTAVIFAVWGTAIYFLLRTIGNGRGIALFISLLSISMPLSLSLQKIYDSTLSVGLIFYAIGFIIKMYTAGDRGESAARWLLYAVAGAISMAAAMISNITFGTGFLLLCMGVLFVVYFISRFQDKRELGGLLGKSLLIGVLACLLIAMPLAEFLQFSMTAERTVGSEILTGASKVSYQEFTGNHSEVTVLSAFFYGNGINSMVGTVIGLCAVAGLFAKKKDANDRFAYVLLAVSCLNMVNFMFADYLWYIPVISSIREQYLYRWLPTFPIAILAAKGCTTFVEGLRHGKALEGFMCRPGLVTVLLCLIVDQLLPLHYTIYTGLTLLCVAALFAVMKWAKMIPAKGVLSIAAVILLCINGRWFWRTFDTASQYTAEQASTRMHETNMSFSTAMDKIKALEPDDPHWRICSWGIQGKDDIPKNSLPALGYETQHCYVNFTVDGTMEMHKRWNLRKRSYIQNIKYYYEPTDSNEDYADFMDWFKKVMDVEKVTSVELPRQYDDGETYTYDVYENKYRGGVCWSVNRYVPYSDSDSAEAVAALVNDESFEPDTAALVNISGLTEEERSALDESLGKITDTEVLDYHSNRVKLKVNALDKALLVSSVRHYPGWNTTVDGEKVKTLEVNYGYNGVILSPGEQIVEFSYEPVTKNVMQWIAIVAWTFSGGIVVWNFLESKKKRKTVKQSCLKESSNV